MPVRRGLATRADADYRETIPRVADCGFDEVELAMEGPHRPRRIHEEAGEVNALTTAEGVELSVLLPVGIGIAAPHERVRRTAKRVQEDAIETARAVGAERAIFRPGTQGVPAAYDPERRRHELVESILDLDAYAEHAGVELCVENVHPGPVGLGAGIPELLEEGVRICLNTGVAATEGFDAAAQASLLVERPSAVAHLHLTDVAPDGAVVPFGSGQLGTDRLLDPAGDVWSGTATLLDWEGRLAAREAADRVVAALDGTTVQAHH